MELSMCIQAVEALSSMWEVASDEDRQGMARHLFEYLTYDLGKRQIVDFRLKPWADQFLTLRAGLYADERGKDDGNPVTPTGIRAVKLSSVLSFANPSSVSSIWRSIATANLTTSPWRNAISASANAA
jgi:hypothetical protein